MAEEDSLSPPSKRVKRTHDVESGPANCSLLKSAGGSSSSSGPPPPPPPIASSDGDDSDDGFSYERPKELPVLSKLQLPSIRNAFLNSLPLSNEHAVVHPKPFPSLVLNGLFPADFLRSLRFQLLETDQVGFTPRSNDLFRFVGSQRDFADPALDLAGTPLDDLRSALYSTDFLSILERITGIALDKGPDARPDLSAHIYRRGDHLLCHDDDIKDGGGSSGRRIAFILYLVPEDWSSSDGGSLDLFDAGNSTPSHSIFPRFGSLALFEVTPTSYHQVAEVTVPKRLEDERFRLSISGWFHGPLACRLADRGFEDDWVPARNSEMRYLAKISGVAVDDDSDEDENEEATEHEPSGSGVFSNGIPLSPKPIDACVDDAGAFPYSLKSLISPAYLHPATQKIVRQRFGRESTIQLTDFLREDVFDALVRDMQVGDLWEEPARGPPEVRRWYGVRKEHLDSSDPKTEPQTVCQVITTLFRSMPFALLVEELTSLPVTKHRVTPRLFRKGCYTLLHDQARDPKGLDVILSLGAVDIAGKDETQEEKDRWETRRRKGKGKMKRNQWEEGWGGGTHYVSAKDANAPEEEEGDEEDTILATIQPSPNTLSITIRDDHTIKFTKYVNCAIDDSDSEAEGGKVPNGAVEKECDPGERKRARGLVEIEAVYLYELGESSSSDEDDDESEEDGEDGLNIGDLEDESDEEDQDFELGDAQESEEEDSEEEGDGDEDSGGDGE